jgi:endoglucanase
MLSLISRRMASLLLVGLFGATNLSFGETPAEAMNRRLGRGVNLGNMLEAPHEGLWGVSLRPEYFGEIANAGFQSVRLPVRWSAHAATVPPYEISEAIFARVEWALEQAEKAGLAVVLNVHHYEEIFREPAEHGPRLIALWQQIAERLKARPSTVVYELLNEPHRNLTPEVWAGLLPQLHAAVRAIDSDRVLMFGPTHYNSIDQLGHLWLPENDERIIVSVHHYQPFQFTHQGAEWVNNSAPWLGTEWSGSETERAEIAAQFDRAAAWSRERATPINLGEFGAYSKAEMASRIRWTRAVRELAEERGFSWHYWEFASGFGVYDPESRRWRGELRDALIAPATAAR